MQRTILFVLFISLNDITHSFILPPAKKVKSQYSRSRLARSFVLWNQSTKPTHGIDNDKLVQWHTFCNDIDQTLEGLVSPAPESFHILHSVIINMNTSANSECSHLNDLCSLSRFLVKPKYSIELYWNSDTWMWKVIPRTSGGRPIIYPPNITKGKDEMHHVYNILELSKMALDIATGTSRDRKSQSLIYEIARQAEV